MSQARGGAPGLRDRGDGGGGGVSAADALNRCVPHSAATAGTVEPRSMTPTRGMERVVGKCDFMWASTNCEISQFGLQAARGGRFTGGNRVVGGRWANRNGGESLRPRSDETNDGAASACRPTRDPLGWVAPRWVAPRWVAPRWVAPCWVAPRWAGPWWSAPRRVCCIASRCGDSVSSRLFRFRGALRSMGSSCSVRARACPATRPKPPPRPWTIIGGQPLRTTRSRDSAAFVRACVGMRSAVLRYAVRGQSMVAFSARRLTGGGLQQ